jgi:hypothetical protein
MNLDLAEQTHAFPEIPPRAVARVFFTYEGDQVREIRGLPLQNHLNTVSLLTRHWDFEAAFGAQQCPIELEQTRPWLIDAARRHDEGKIRRFSLRCDGPHKWNYSFSGHRFEVSDHRLYVQWLIRLHHGFSVNDVTEAQARLKQSNDPTVAAVACCFPLDLYALEMCDQIEAEVATKAFGQPSSHRVFMEFETCMKAPPCDDGIIHIGVFPYPFSKPEVRFRMESFVVAVPEKVRQEGQALKQLLLNDGEVVRKEHKEIQLCAME